MIDTLKRRIGFNPLAWLAGTRRMRAQVRAFDTGLGPQPGAPRVAVVITPWLGTSIPWFSLAVGLLLARNGCAVSFLLDDFPFGGNALRHRFVLRCLRSVLGLLRGRFEVIELSALQPTVPMGPAQHASIDRLARLNTVWQLRGEMVSAGRMAFAERCKRQLAAAYGAIAHLMQPGAYDLLFVPGGVFASSGIWTERARAAGIRIGSYDSGGYGTVMIAANGIACQLQDIPAAFAQLKASATPASEHHFANEQALAEMAKRRAGTDTFASQVPGSHGGDARFNGAVVLALNSSWDSAALGLHTVFDDNSQWIVETVRFLLDYTAAPVIVRQHPAERLPIAATSDDYAALLHRHIGAHPRLHFIGAAEKINSYDLLERVAAVVVYTSTIGIEAAAEARPVITPSSSYYSKLGFVWRAENLAQYQALLRDAALGGLTVTPTMQQDARLCYYLTQCCNWVFSPLNPADFAVWSRTPLAQWHADATVQGVLQALQANTPVALLNHAARLKQQAHDEHRIAA